MPILRLSSDEAVATRKANPDSGWGSRGGPNRVEPIAVPGFTAGFQLFERESIFTIGSCFARHVELELETRGFDIPIRNIFRTEEFKEYPPDFINNYGTPSIFHELSWALDPDTPFVTADHFVEVDGGKFIDLHMAPKIKPGDFETVSRRRSALTTAYQSVARCRVVIITLGLVEVWFDTKTNTYLNHPVRPSLLKQQPGRFEFHVLDYRETFDYLDRALGLLKKFGHPELRLLLTVSPVPLAATHQSIDVMVANTYSKSVLRAVAGEICARHDFVHYYPSYESVTLTDRSRAWVDDLIHVQRDIISLNISRMIHAYVGGLATDQIADEIEQGGDAIAGLKAEEARKAGSAATHTFFDRYGNLANRYPSLAAAYGRYLLGLNEFLKADLMLASVPEDLRTEAILVLQARCAIGLGDPKKAVGLIQRYVKENPASKDAYTVLIEALFENSDPDAAVAAAAAFVKIYPYRRGVMQLALARGFRKVDASRARHFYLEAVKLHPTRGTVALEAAEFLTRSGMISDARLMIEGIEPTYPSERDRLKALQSRLNGGLFARGMRIFKKLPMKRGPTSSRRSPHAAE